MANPFTQPPAGRVLNPCENSDDLSLYLDLDNHEACMAQVRQESASFDPFQDGAAVLIHGKSGCGKRALANRVAHELRGQYNQAPQAALVIHLDSELGQLGLSMDAKFRTQCQLLCDKLSRGVLAEPEAKALAERVEDPVRFMDYLDALLAQHQLLIILAFARFELEAELDRTVQLWRRKRIVCIFSTAFDPVADRARDLYGSMSSAPIVLLRVGPLRLEDGWTFVNDRTSRLAADQRPSVDREVLDEYMGKRMENSDVSVRELFRTCRTVFASVLEDGRNEVTIKDFADFWMKFGRQ